MIFILVHVEPHHQGGADDSGHFQKIPERPRHEGAAREVGQRGGRRLCRVLRLRHCRASQRLPQVRIKKLFVKL